MKVIKVNTERDVGHPSAQDQSDRSKLRRKGVKFHNEDGVIGIRGLGYEGNGLHGPCSSKSHAALSQLERKNLGD